MAQLNQPHNHSDRGVLHEECRACQHILELMNDAGVSTLVRLAQPFAPADDAVGERLDVAGVEMANKVSLEYRESDVELPPFRDWPAEHARGLVRFFDDLLNLAVVNQSTAAVINHAYFGHEEWQLPAHLDLRQAQEVHASLHHMDVGHGGSVEHFMPPANIPALRAARNRAVQSFDHELAVNTRRTAHEERAAAAIADRERVQRASALALQRAIAHTDGTVASRVMLRHSHVIQVTTGVKRPITLAKAALRLGEEDITGIGTALCRPGDTWRPQVGTPMAIGRALRALGHQIEARGFHHDAEESS